MSAPRFDNLTEETISTALSYIDPAVDRDEWARMAMAIKSELGDAGFSIWDDWSKPYERYSEKAARDTWRSIRPHGGVGIGTLIFAAQQRGFKLDDTQRHVMTAEEIAERQKRREADERKATAEKKRIQGEVAKIANLAWDAAEVANDNHPYLQRKQVKAYGLRVGEFPLYGDSLAVFKRIKNTLLMPILDPKTGKITSLQGIFPRPLPDGDDRLYLRGGKKHGGYHVIGAPTTATLVVCEGYATGASIYEATGWAVFVAFDKTSLAPVAKSVREHFPHARIVVAADNDQWTKDNPGMTYATKAAQAVNGLVIEPIFTDDSTQPTDFNDLHLLEGIYAVSERLHSFDPPMKAANDNDTKLPAVVDFYTPLPSLTKNGKPKSTIENLHEICQRLGVTIRYNVIKKEEEILIPGEAFLVDNAAGGALARLMSRCAEFDFPTGNLGAMVTYLASQNNYNPVANWIASKPWDGTSRVQALCETLTPVEHKTLPDGSSLRDALVKRWLVSAVAAAFRPDGVSAHGVLVLQGPQYLGKTKWFTMLAPQELDVLQDGMMLRPDDRDSVKQVLSYWMVELGELDATFRKSDIAALKAFLTRKSDTLRRAYAIKENCFARRTVFFASVNPRAFLHDPTGNRRFWTIECAAINHDHGLDMQQVWAEVYELWRQGETYYLTPDEMAALNEHNEDFQVTDPIEERLQTRLAWDADQRSWLWKTATDLLISIGLDKPTQGDATRAGHYIRKRNGGQGKRATGKNLLLVPPIVYGAHSSDGPY